MIWIVIVMGVAFAASQILFANERASAIRLDELRVARIHELESELAEATEDARFMGECVERTTSPIPGLAETGPYTLEDVDRIEAHRGKPYVRLRETVTQVGMLEEELLAAAQRINALVKHSGETHTAHCWARLSWGDGECECGGIQAAKSPETARPATNATSCVRCGGMDPNCVDNDGLHVEHPVIPDGVP